MASAGPNAVGAGADDSSVGSFAWTNPNNIVTDDRDFARANLVTVQHTHYLVGSAFGFTIPSGATIDGIVCEINRHANQLTRAFDERVRIVKGGTIGSTDRSNAGSWPNTNTYQSYGSSSDQWGESWSYSDINASNFGLAFMAQSTNSVALFVYHFRITVYYTAGGGGAPVAQAQTHYARLRSQ